MKGWHFAGADMRLGYDDGRKIRDGRTLRHDGELVLCEAGLHASASIFDAFILGARWGPMICRVELGGDIVQGVRKVVASSRKCLWHVDGTELLRHYERLCALDVAHVWDAPDVVLRYLRTGDESLRVAARTAAAAHRVTPQAETASSDAKFAEKDAVWAAKDATDIAGNIAWHAAGIADSARRAAVQVAGNPEDVVITVMRKQTRRLLRLVHAERRRKYGETHAA